MRRLIESGGYLKIGRYKEIFSFNLTVYKACKKFRTILVSDKKVSENKTVQNFQASENFTVQENHAGKPKQNQWVKEGLGDGRNNEAKAVTKELEPGKPFKNSSRRLSSHFELQSSYREQTL